MEACTHTYRSTSTNIYTSMHIYMYIYICMPTCMYAHVHVDP